MCFATVVYIGIMERVVTFAAVVESLQPCCHCIYLTVFPFHSQWIQFLLLILLFFITAEPSCS